MNFKQHLLRRVSTTITYRVKCLNKKNLQGSFKLSYTNLLILGIQSIYQGPRAVVIKSLYNRGMLKT